MPTVLREWPHGFHFYLGHRSEPPHVHVQRGNQTARFLNPVALQGSGGLRPHETRPAERIKEEHEGDGM